MSGYLLVALFCLPKYPRQGKEIKMSIKLYNEKYRKEILAFAHNYKVPGYAWDDIVQELEIILLRKLPQYRGDNLAKERTFAFRVMRNRITDLVRGTKRQKRALNNMCFLFSEVAETPEGQHTLENAKSIFDYEK